MKGFSVKDISDVNTSSEVISKCIGSSKGLYII